MSIPNYSSYSDPNMPGAFPNDGMMPPSGKNTMAVVALVLAIIGLVTCWVAILGFLLSIIGVILSIIALVKVKNYPPVTAGKGMRRVGWPLRYHQHGLCGFGGIRVLYHC